MKITQEERDVLMDLAAEFDHVKYDPERHILIEDGVKMWGIGERAAQGRLDKLVVNGKWGKETVIHNGRQKNGYYKKG